MNFELWLYPGGHDPVQPPAVAPVQPEPSWTDVADRSPVEANLYGEHTGEPLDFLADNREALGTIVPHVERLPADADPNIYGEHTGDVVEFVRDAEPIAQTVEYPTVEHDRNLDGEFGPPESELPPVVIPEPITQEVYQLPALPDPNSFAVVEHPEFEVPTVVDAEPITQEVYQLPAPPDANQYGEHGQESLDAAIVIDAPIESWFSVVPEYQPIEYPNVGPHTQDGGDLDWTAPGTVTLHTINGGKDGQILVIRKSTTAPSDIVVESGSGNIRLNGGLDRTMDSDEDLMKLFYVSDVGLWLESGEND